MDFEELIMSKDKYPSIFSKSAGGYCVYYHSNIFRNSRGFVNGGIFSDIPQFKGGNNPSCDSFRPIARGENISLMNYKQRYTACVV